MPELPVVTVRHKRHLRPEDRARCTPHFRDVPADGIHQGVTTPLQTALLGALREAASTLHGRGAASARLVADHASYVAANPMESVLRAIARGVEEFAFVPQLRVWKSGLSTTVDLGDEQLKVVLEADGFAYHTARREFRRDCRRYDELVAWGWTVFRFTWEQIMLEPDFVRWCLTSLLASRRGERVAPAPRPPDRLA